MTPGPRPTFATLLLRGALRRCPRCGQGRLFRGFYGEIERCPACGLHYDPNSESFGLFFVSTAALTGVFFFLLYLVRPRSPALAQLWLLPVALVAYLGSMPIRKGLAIALTYWLRGGDER